MSTWEPQPESTKQLVEILGAATSSDSTARQRATKQLDEAKKQEDLNHYLVYLLVNSNSASENVRATAGSVLRQNVLRQFTTISPQSLEYIKQEIVNGLKDNKTVIRGISGNVVTTIVCEGGVANWINVLPTLMNMAETQDSRHPMTSLGAMTALAKICEDSAPALDQDFNGERPLNHLIPKFLQFSTDSPDPKIRSAAISCLIQFVIHPSQSLLAHIDEFLNTLFSLASDPEPDIRKNVCSAFVNLLDVRPDKLIPHIDGVINYALHCIKDTDEYVAAEGGEFILALADSTQISDDVVKPHLPKILPVILPAMVYSEDDRLVLEMQAEDDEDQEDRPEDVRPSNARSKDSHTVSNKESGDANNEDSDDEDDDEDDLDMTEWSLRKCCAATFDGLATRFGQEVLEISLPYLRDNIQSNEWHVREAAILGFGAIAEGCINMLSAQLPELVPFLVQRLNDDQAPVRQIACWTLGRYCSWVVQTLTPETRKTLFFPILEGLLKRCLDKNKKVQESGCSAFATFTEQAGEELIPYLEPILMHFSMCFKKYKNKNLVVLYDAIQTLVDHVSTALCEQKYVDLLLPPLMDKWSKLQDDDRDLCPLFECLSSVTATLGEGFAQYAPPVFERANRILKDTLVQEQHYQEDTQNMDPPDKDFVIVSLDLLDGLVQGLGSHASQLIQSNNSPPLVEMMMMCFQDEIHEVRQSAFALLGDMVISTFDQVRPYLDQMIQESKSHISVQDFEARRVCNNACWALGEIALQCDRQQMEPYAQDIFQRLVNILQATHTSRMVQENAAITIGRLGKILPDVIAPHLQVFADRWCELILAVEETDEKDSAFRGMCQIVGANPSGLSNEQSLLKFLETVGYYQEPSPELAVLVQKLLQGYKSFVQDWSQLMNKVPQPVQQSLARYGA